MSMTPSPTHEMIIGPIRGYYVAAYACPTGDEDEHYAPYFKLFDSRPESYFEQVGCVVKGRPPLMTNDPSRALFLALVHAEEMIDTMPAPSELHPPRSPSLLDSVQAVATAAAMRDMRI